MIGSAPFIAAMKFGHLEGEQLVFRGLYSPLVINHLVNGMILQVGVVHKALWFLDVV